MSRGRAGTWMQRDLTRERWEADNMPSDPNPKTRVWIAFLLLFVVFAVGAWFVSDLSRLQRGSAVRDSPVALQDITRPGQIDEALAQHPQNRFLRLTAMAIQAANETGAAAEKLSSEVEPSAVRGIGNLGAASRDALEALRRDLKTAETNATTFMPRYLALLKSERDKVEKHALSLNAGNETTCQAAGSHRQAARGIYGPRFQAAVGAIRTLSRLWRLCRDSGRRIRRLQGRRRPIHLPAATHGGPLQCRGPRDARDHQARRRTGRGKKKLC